MSSWLRYAVLFFNLGAFAQQTPLTQRQACAQFSSAVVRIDAGGEKSGTGFLVSADGFVLTAFHIVADETTNNYFPSIVVGLPDGTSELAKPVAGSSGQEYAILKVPRKNKFPYLELGSIEDVGAGSSAALIGYPFGAALHQDKSISTKFCLSTTIAAKDALALKTESVKTDVIYFQGPSIQGTSGAPLISLENGRVIGIEIAGLRKKQTASSVPADHPSSVTINTILSVLVGERFEIGLGAATGIDEPARALKQAQRDLAATETTR
jgi:S1-C subfamily serine protease